MQCSKEPFSSSGKPNIWCKLGPKSLLDHLQHLSTSSQTQMAQNVWAQAPEEEAGWGQKNNIARAMLQLEQGVGRISTMPIKAGHAALPQNSSVLIARHQNISSSVKWVISFFFFPAVKPRWYLEKLIWMFTHRQFSKGNIVIVRSWGGCFSTQTELPRLFLWAEGFRKQEALLLWLHLSTLHQARH